MAILSDEARAQLEQTYKDTLKGLSASVVGVLMGRHDDFLSGAVLLGAVTHRLLKDDEERKAAGLPEVRSVYPTRDISKLLETLDAEGWSREAVIANMLPGLAEHEDREEETSEDDGELIDTGEEYDADMCEDCPSRNRCKTYTEYHAAQDKPAQDPKAPMNFLV